MDRYRDIKSTGAAASEGGKDRDIYTHGEYYGGRQESLDVNDMKGQNRRARVTKM